MSTASYQRLSWFQRKRHQDRGKSCHHTETVTNFIGFRHMAYHGVYPMVGPIVFIYGLPGHNAKLHPKSRLSEGRDPLPVAMKRTVTPYQTSRIEYQMLCKKSILIFTLLCVTEVGWMINEADLRPALAGERQRLSFTALPLPQRSEASVTRCVAMEVLPKQPALSRNSLPEPDRTQQAVVAIAHWGGPASRRV